MLDLRKKVAITGLGITKLADRLPQRTTMNLACEAAMAAIHDAGLRKQEIDGIVTAEMAGQGEIQDPRRHTALSEYLDIFPKRLAVSIPLGGASAGIGLEAARWAVATGRCRNVLVAAAGRLGSQGHGAAPAEAWAQAHSATYEQPYGPLVATYYAALARRHMHEFGTTSAQMAAVAVACRRNASLNPEAVMRTPITVEDVLNSDMVSSPLHLLDCATPADGGCAWVVSSAKQAQSLRKPPVWVLGSGYSQSPYFTGALAAGDASRGFDFVHTVGTTAGKTAFGEAGVAPDDIDLAELYDNCTITVLMQLEELGFCEKGEGGSFAAGGRLALGGQLPTNTHGGLLSCGHFGATDFLSYVEAARQLRNEGGERQVRGARLALVSSVGGVASNYSVHVLARD